MIVRSRINTKIDGMQPIEYWSKEEFTGRTMKFYSGNSFKNMDLEQVVEIPDDTIVCDFCNDGIDEFPVPIFMGNALCKECFERIQK